MSDEQSLRTVANALRSAISKRVKEAEDDETGQTEQALRRQLSDMEGILGTESALPSSRPGIGAQQD